MGAFVGKLGFADCIVLKFNGLCSLLCFIFRQNDKTKYCFNDGKNPIEQVPKELKEYLIRYEVSSYNEVTESSGLMINYYFDLNDKI